VEAARRLGVHETAVRTVEDREDCSVVTLRDGTLMLVSDTVARPYVAEVDDAKPDDEHDDAKEEAPKPAARKAAAKAGKAV
jgi:hypothetical protein